MKKAFTKNPFVRRRSSGNVLESTAETVEEPVQSSFKVLERPDKRITFDGTDRRAQSQARLSQVRPFNSPIHNLRGKSAEDLGAGTNRGSGGTTNSGSSGYFVDSSSASARYSSTSTLPSSLDQDREHRERERERDDDELFPKKRATVPMHYTPSSPADHSLPAPPSFSSRASRAFSFGLKSKQNQQQLQQPAVYTPAGPSSPLNGIPQSPMKSHSPPRERAMTTSSYASTAVPPRLDAKPDLGATDFGSDFDTNMFSSIKADDSQHKALPAPSVNGFHRTESEPMFPPKSYSRTGLTPSPVQGQPGSRERAESPYSFDGRNSNDGLFSSSAVSSPLGESAPTFPQASSIAPAFLGGAKQAYARVPDRNGSPGFESLSQESRDGFTGQTGQEREYSNDSRAPARENGFPARKPLGLADPQESAREVQDAWRDDNRAGPSGSRTQAQASAGAMRNGATSPGDSEGGSLWGAESRNTTPRAARLQPQSTQDESLFDVSPSGPPSRAVRPVSNARQFTANGTPKKMTKAQFDLLQRRGDSSGDHSENETHSGDEYDDEDDAERAKKVTTQRRKQEANMAIYRQQMKRSTGGGPTDLPGTRPGVDRNASSMSGLHLGGIGGTPPPEAVRGKESNDDDEDVPLGILQAHGFPGGARPPMRLGEGSGSVVNGGAGQGNLPPFARRLPADPYFGAGIVNPPNRESLAFSSSASAYGGGSPHLTPMGNPMPMPGGHPGGLVGVIASEESAKAARRGSPNANGGYNMPLPNNMPPRTMSMGNLAPPSMFPGGMPPMPGMPMMGPQADQGQQMQQFMAMQMRFMQQMMAMQQTQMGQAPPQAPPGSFLGVPGSMASRPVSMASHAPSFVQRPEQSRSMTMLNPPPGWGNVQQPQRPNSFQPLQSTYAPSAHGLNMYGGTPGYTPSIAPSERSNIGMPSRYRPVQTGEGSSTANGRSQSMTSSMTLNALQNQQPVAPAAEAKSTIRVIEKAKGSQGRAVEKAADEDEEEGWAEMAKKRNESKFRWGRKKREDGGLGEMYRGLD
ncbi:hypothetical protein B0A48_05848 [Cryoendolithus antarcticus]|uniref:Uncharacterized protein n=1 Tax=Cryoendolithus antarcticus TaxID=1507870 RepID=A0A1V8TCG6_9PEZI|nr:hypothetical protein B0A48_05848 [Cryoendolithus antarcticus]